MPDTVQRTTYPTGSYVTVTVTGRVVHHNGTEHSGGLVIEHLSSSGFPTRESFDIGSAAVSVVPAAAPGADVLRAAERAARLTAGSCHDLEARWGAHQDHVDRWNEAFPPGTAVRYWTGVREGAGVESTTRTSAELLGGHTAAVWVEGHGACIALSHVEAVAR